MLFLLLYCGITQAIKGGTLSATNYMHNLHILYSTACDYKVCMIAFDTASLTKLQHGERKRSVMHGCNAQ